MSGLWHGAGWNFIFYGLLHAIYFLITLLLLGHKKSFNSNTKDKVIPSLKESLSMVLTFILVSFSYIFFRAENLAHAFSYISGIFSESILAIPSYSNSTLSLLTLSITIVFIVIEWIGRNNAFAIQNLENVNNRFFRYGYYLIIVFTILILGNFNQNEFIYFQF